KAQEHPRVFTDRLLDGARPPLIYCPTTGQVKERSREGRSVGSMRRAELRDSPIPSFRRSSQPGSCGGRFSRPASIGFAHPTPGARSRCTGRVRTTTRFLAGPIQRTFSSRGRRLKYKPPDWLRRFELGESWKGKDGASRSKNQRPVSLKSISKSLRLICE